MDDPKSEILKRLQEDAEELGKQGDRAAIPVLLEVLAEPGAPLAAMALRALRYLDPRALVEALADAERCPGALHHRDFFARVLSNKHAGECLDLLLPRDPATPALTVPAAAFLRERIGTAMFAPAAARLPSAPPAELTPLAALLEAHLDRPRAAQLAALRPALSTALPAPEDYAMRLQRLAAIENLLASACARFSIDPRELDGPAAPTATPILAADRSGTTKRTRHLDGSAELTRSGVLTRPDVTAPEPPPSALRPMPVLITLGCAALIALFLMPSAPAPAASNSTATRAAAKKPVSLVGETGETIALNAKVIDFNADRRLMNVMGPGSVKLSVAVPSAVPGPIQAGSKVRVVGTISDVAGRKSVSLDAQNVTARP